MVRHTTRHRRRTLSSAPDRGARRSAVIVQSSQHATRRLSEETVVDVARAVTVTFRGLSNRHQPSHSHGTRITAMTKRNLAKNDQGTQRSFGLIVCRRHTRIIQKDKPLVLMLQNSLLQCHCFSMTDWKSDQLQQSFSQPYLFGFLLGLRELSLLAQAMKATSFSNELPNGVEERKVC